MAVNPHGSEPTVKTAGILNTTLDVARLAGVSCALAIFLALLWFSRSVGFAIVETLAGLAGLALAGLCLLKSLAMQRALWAGSFVVALLYLVLGALDARDYGLQVLTIPCLLVLVALVVVIPLWPAGKRP